MVKMGIEIEDIDGVVDYNNVNNSKNNNIADKINGDIINNIKNNDNDDYNTNNKNNNFIPNQYFITPKDDAPENIDDILLKKFEELGMNMERDVKYFKLVRTYCVTIKNPEALKELESLEYITLERVGIVRALSPED